MAPENPSFFKIVTFDFNRQIRIPSHFSRQHRQILVEGDVTLRSSSGQTWKVKLEITEGEHYEFAGGWSGFAEDAALEFGDFLVFWVVGESLFDVAVYEPSCCEREIPANSSTGEERRIHPEVGNVGDSESLRSLEKSEKPLHFKAVLKKHNRSRMYLPKNFLEAAGLKGKPSVRLLYLPTNRYHTVALDSKCGYKTDLALGWFDFRKANGLIYGKSYSFEFVPTKNVIHVLQL